VDDMIVVGVDGSEGAGAALEFAAAEAVLRKTPLRIVCAWMVPPMAYGGDLGPPLDAATWDALRERAEKVADDALAEAKKLQPSLEGEAVVIQGSASDVLLAQAADAELVVVGRRGLGGFKSLLLGSVSQQVVHYAPCPVVVVQ
jgi:nucleotide-binding universal stress UspA family protein